MTTATWTFYLLLTWSLVLYVYRFAAFGINLSLFRMVLVGWLAVLAADLARGRVRLDRRHLPFVAIVAGLVVINAIDFAALSGYPTLRRDIVNHSLNVLLSGLVLVYVRTQARIHGLLQAFVLSSTLTTVVALYAGTMNALPFEGLIRTLGSEQARALTYVNDDAIFERATSTFFDPNFYGIYCMLVVVSIMYLWLHDRPARHLAFLFVVNLTCLTLTLSRTAVVGALAGFALTFVLAPRARRFAAGASVATVALLYASTAFQSYDGFAQLQDQAQAGVRSIQQLFERHDGPATPGGRSGVPGDADGSAQPAESVRRNVQSRVANARSLAVRGEFIDRGVAVFRKSPLIGSGSAGLVTPEMPLSTAHLAYLTLLARYGLVGTCVYLAYLLLPLALVWLGRTPAGPRLLVTLTTVPLLVVYLSYDIFMFFEVQYLFFGVAYATALYRPWAEVGAAGSPTVAS